jgi:predicted  nucleic acid-binding Zn-ribbon protein
MIEATLKSMRKDLDKLQREFAVLKEEKEVLEQTVDQLAEDVEVLEKLVGDGEIKFKVLHSRLKLKETEELVVDDGDDEDEDAGGESGDDGYVLSNLMKVRTCVSRSISLKCS